LPEPLSKAVLRRIEDWLEGHFDQVLRPLLQILESSESAIASGALRSIVRALAVRGGHAERIGVEASIRALSGDERQQLRRIGVVVGSLDIYHPGLLKPAPVAMLAILRAAVASGAIGPLPMPGMGLLHRPSPSLAAAARASGYRAFDDQMVRIDLVERVACALHEQRKGQDAFLPDVRLATSIGIGEETLARIMRALGFRRAGPEIPPYWRWRGLDRPARAPAKPLNPSFAALGDWKGTRP